MQTTTREIHWIQNIEKPRKRASVASHSLAAHVNTSADGALGDGGGGDGGAIGMPQVELAVTIASPCGHSAGYLMIEITSSAERENTKAMLPAAKARTTILSRRRIAASITTLPPM